MKFQIKCSNERVPEGWWETYDENTDDAQGWAEDIVESFNNTLHAGELPRTLLAVVVLERDTKRAHTWRKMNQVTLVSGSGRMYDKYVCELCGVTGRRYGLERVISRDRKYKAKVYLRCDTAQRHLERKAKRGQQG